MDRRFKDFNLVRRSVEALMDTSVAQFAIDVEQSGTGTNTGTLVKITNANYIR